MKNNIIVISALLLTFCSCKKNREFPLAIPPAEVQYSSVDSMKLNSQSANFIDPITYSQVNNKQHIVNSNKVEMRVGTDPGNNDVTLFISEKSNPNQETGLYMHFKNRNINNVSGNYSLPNDNICVEWIQNLEESYWIRTSPTSCENIISGNLNIQLDPTTNTVSGKIEKLKYLFGEYSPLYVNGYRPLPSLAGWLKASGSSRNQDISFRYIKY